MFFFRRSLAAAPLILLLASPAFAMSAGEFLGKVDVLKAKGPLALFSSDIGLLKREGEGAAKAWRVQVAPPGRPRNACPPPGDLKLSDTEFLDLLRAVPPQQRATVSVTDAVTTGLNRRFPCR